MNSSNRQQSMNQMNGFGVNFPNMMMSMMGMNMNMNMNMNPIGYSQYSMNNYNPNPGRMNVPPRRNVIHIDL